MKLRLILAVASLVAIATGVQLPAGSQPSSTGQYQPGFWQPQAQVDLNRDLQILLLNQTGLNLEYGQTASTNIYTLPAGGTANVLIRMGTRTGDIANIPINVKDGTSALKYEYNVDPQSNIVTVRITAIKGTAPTDRAVYIDERGRVYSF